MGVTQRLKGLDAFSRVGVILLATLLAYILFICVVFPMVKGEGFFSDELLDFRTPEHVHLNLIAIVLGLAAGTGMAIYTRPRECAEKHRIMADVLSKDEQLIVDIVKEAGEITQDSLTFRLGWQRPKLSTILTQLERMNIIQRRREGKTYVVFLAKKH